MSPRARSIIADVAKEHGVTAEDLCSRSRVRRLAYPRFDAMSRLRALHNAPGRHVFSLPQIGNILGGRDHTSVIHGLRKAAELFGPRPPVYPVHESEETRI